MTSRSSNTGRIVLAVAMTTVVALAGMQLGCASNQLMHSAASVPASMGQVGATSGDNGNTDLTVQVEHLALPWKVVLGTTVYVVWVQAPNADWQSVGALSLDDDLEGTLETVTPHRRFLVMVTPELSGVVAKPTNDAVLTADVDLDARVL
jgi:hypothetical protein